MASDDEVKRLLRLATHPKAAGHPVYKDAKLQRLNQEVLDLHERLKFNKQDIDILEDDLQRLDRFRKDTLRGGRGRAIDTVLDMLGFDMDAVKDVDERKRVLKDAAEEIQKNRTKLRMKMQERDRLLKAIGERLKMRDKVERELIKQRREKD